MKIDRLMGILTTLLQSNAVTAPQLAKKFEVTRRTIGRDIDALCMAGIPIVTRQGGNGGISLADGYKIDKSVLTVPELQTLLAAVKGLGTVDKDSHMERVLDKLVKGGEAVVSLRESMVIDLSSYYKGSLSAKISSIKKAIAASNLIAFDYYSDKGQARRQVEPYCIVFQWSAWYVFGFCLDRQDFRLFKMNRLWELETLRDTFRPREVPPNTMDFAARFTDEHRLTAVFHPCARHLLIDAYGPDCFKTQADGSLLFSCGYTNRPYIIGWILSFGDKAKVLEPMDMALEIKETARNMFLAYNEQDK